MDTRNAKCRKDAAREFDAELFVEGIRERIPARQVPEWYDADLLMSVSIEMNFAKLSPQQRHAVFSYLGVKEQDIPAIIAEGLAANAEPRWDLEEGDIKSCLDFVEDC